MRHISRQHDILLNPPQLPPQDKQPLSPSLPPVLPPQPSSIIHKLAVANEQTWLLIGRVAEQMGDLEHALSAYENALRHNPMSLSGLTQVAGIARIKENYPKAVDYFQRVLTLQEDNGEVWSALGHCYLMQDDLQKAYSAYQQALYLLPNPKEDPKLWYGIGILYDRYGSLDHAEEAFSSVLRMDKDLDFDKANEILFRLGIIYKQQGKYDDSLTCFDRILRNPPSPLAHADIWFQIGHVYEQQKDHVRAKDAYERVVADNPGHAKVLQQLGWLYHQDGSSFQNQDLAIQYLTKSLEADASDAQSWYLLGRAYMAGQKYNKAYEAYQQAVYRDGRNPTFWCSIGVLYFQINQFRDALDAYSRAIRINPYISEVWFDLGSLYESCNNQISDAIDAYARASELDPANPVISQRLQLLKTAQATGGQLPAAPGPQDVHPTAYASAVVPPPGLTGPPLLLQSGSSRPVFRTDSRGPGEGTISLPPPSQVGAGRSSPGPFRGGPPPPVIIDESRHIPSHTPLAPMDVDRPPIHSREYPRDGPNRGPSGHQSILLHHPVPQQQLPTETIRNGAHGPVHHQDPYFGRPPLRALSASMSPPPPHASRPRSPPLPFQPYPSSNRQPVGPAQPSAARSPHIYSHEPRATDQEIGWERRPPPHHREWEGERERERERRPRHSSEYSGPPVPSFYAPSRSPAPPRAHSPNEHSPRSAHPSRMYFPAHPVHTRHSPPLPPVHHEQPGRRYDPRFDGRDHRDHDAQREIIVEQRLENRSSYAGSPEGLRGLARNPTSQHLAAHSARTSESPRPTPAPPESKERRKRLPKEKEPEAPPPPTPAPAPAPPGPDVPPKRRRRNNAKRMRDEAPLPSESSSKLFAAERIPAHLAGPASFKLGYGHPKDSPETASSGSGTSGRSMQPSPTSATPRPPSRVVDEDYDEGVAETLTLMAHRAPPDAGPTPGLHAADHGEPTHSPAVSSGSRHSHRGSVSSSRSRASPPVSLKRALSPGPDDLSENKRSRIEVAKRRSPASGPSGPAGRTVTPLPPTRHSPNPNPFRAQPASHSPETRQGVGASVSADPYPPSSPLPAVLPPHPRPIGAGHAAHGSGSASGISFPPIATLSPTSSAASPGGMTDSRDERMRSVSPPGPPPGSGSGRMKQVGDGSGRRGSRTPPKHTPSPPLNMKMDG